MSSQLLSVGLDVGTTSTQLILSRLKVENKASAFAVPELEITDREILYKSPVHFTPLQQEQLVDGRRLRQLVEAEYRSAGIDRADVDTGAVIVTGETSRKENADRVLSALSEFAGDFVVAVAGPDLESVLAAKGSGAVDWSEKTGKTVLHMDIGGGTSNLALIEQGRITHTGCLNVGGRLVKLDENNRVIYRSPCLAGLYPLSVGQVFTEEAAKVLASILVRALEMAAGHIPWERSLEPLLTEEASGRIPERREAWVLSFSGGVADCMQRDYPWNAFGDIGPVLGRCIRESSLCRGEYLLGKETIRATVIGAGCHTTQLSGSTVYHQNIPFPLKNLPVVPLGKTKPKELSVLILQEEKPMSYGDIRKLAQRLAELLPDPAILCLRQDMAKALGQALALQLPRTAGILCIDRIRAREGDYLDIGAPVGNAMPVVVKTLVLGNNRRCI